MLVTRELNKLFEKGFNNTDISKREAFVNLIQSQEQEKVVVKTKGKGCIISLGRIVQVACKTNVGSLTSIRTKEEDECNPIKYSTEKGNQPKHQRQSTIKKDKAEALPKATTEHQRKILANIDLAGLTSKQKEMVRQVIKEECDLFSGDEDDIGDVRSHPMKTNLKDDHRLFFYLFI